MVQLVGGALSAEGHGAEQHGQVRPGAGGGRGGNPQESVDALKQARINSVFYVSQNTAHEWLT